MEALVFKNFSKSREGIPHIMKRICLNFAHPSENVQYSMQICKCMVICKFIVVSFQRGNRWRRLVHFISLIVIKDWHRKDRTNGSIIENEGCKWQQTKPVNHTNFHSISVRFVSLQIKSAWLTFLWILGASSLPNFIFFIFLKKLLKIIMTFCGHSE